MRKRNLDKSAQRKWAQTPKSLGVLLMVLVLLLAACQPSADPTQEPTPVSGAEPTQAEPAPEGEVSEPQASVDQNPDLVGTPWVLVMYGEPASPTVVEAGTVVTAVFAADGSLTGSAGCNNYSTTYQVSGDQLTVNSPMAVTAMACEAGMEQESVYLAALETAQSYEINAQGSLVIAYQGGALVYIAQRAPLVRTLWTLATMGPVDNPQVPVAGANFTATFQRSGGAPTGLVSGATGCNEYAASYFAGLNQLKINLPATTANTNCAAGLAEQEQEYYRALFAARDYRILGDRLQVSYDSNVLTFIATPEGAPEAGALTPLNGTKWWYISSDTQIRIPETEITAEFAINPDGTTGTMSGFAGCNTYSFEILGVYQLGSPVVTKTFCENPPGVMEQEVAYLAALESAISITYSAEEVRNQHSVGNLDLFEHTAG